MPKVPEKSKLLVTESDLADLRRSGLTDKTIRDNGLRTATSSESTKIAKALHCSESANACHGSLVFPYRDVEGNVNCFARVRPHTPRRGNNGKLVKYEQPRGEPLRAYFPVASLGKLRDGKSPIHLTEGEKKALALSQLGIAAVGIGGVDCWGKNGQLIADLAALNWTGREVYIVFDYDEKPTTRQNVAAAKRRLAKALKAAGAKEVFSVELPPGPEGSKQGIDDFLVTSGADGARLFSELLSQAKPAIPQSDFQRYMAANRSKRQESPTSAIEHQELNQRPRPNVKVRSCCSAAELVALDLPEPRCIVNPILTDGLNLLVSRPKLGKSWMALQVGLAIASGMTVLGGLDTVPGDVLYLALNSSAPKPERGGRSCGTREGLFPKLVVAQSREQRRTAPWKAVSG